MDHSPQFLKIVEEAKSKIEQTDVHTVGKRLKAGEKLLILDVREESEFAQAHVQGSFHLGKGILERDIEDMVPDFDREIILYCGGGFRSALAAENLQRMGYKNPVSMDGGFKAWVAAGLPVVLPQG